MELVYTTEKPPAKYRKSIFLAGPTPRNDRVASWRPQALKLLEDNKFDGVVFVPEARRGKITWSKKTQVSWEWECLDMADCVLFWVPRNLKTLPGFTTNIELGLYAKSGKIIFGAPKGSPKTSYPVLLAERFSASYFHTLEETIATAINSLGNGALRQGGERYVPLQIWNTASFQSWYQAQKSVGNRLDGARLEWVHRVGVHKEKIYCWALHVNVYIANENRSKHNEIVISRSDISSILLYRKRPEINDTQIVLVREFRSPARTRDGFVHELPGGSSWKIEKTPLDVAVEETEQEAGLKVEPLRFCFHGSTQLVGTFSSHAVNLFSVELTEDELQKLEQDSKSNLPHGDSADFSGTGERAYVEIVTLYEIYENGLVDLSTLGMIAKALKQI